MTVLARVRAPASTANLGPGFDCAAVALDLWNELEVSEGNGGADLGHLGVRAYARLASPEGKRFTFTDGIPRERGLGSSAAIIALGLVAASVVSGRELTPEELLAEGVPLEGHGDNLAAALAGGACLTWGSRIARLADRPPAVPIALVPDATVSTAAARDALPEQVSHADASFTAARATLLGAALATGSGELFAEALADRLHEPHRAAHAPLLEDVRAQLPAGALGATISGSGPTVVVWARDDAVAECVSELGERYPDVDVLSLPASPKGAHAL
ncbi:MAG TPA: homoserine kinase [Gaiellaceae bacterium]|nr:homoserine kinase [Gaiellaceae bacterium]